MSQEQNLDGIYPADLQETARKRYEALPSSGTVAQLITEIKENLDIFMDEGKGFTKGDSHVEVGWKSDILVRLGSEETREVIDIGTMQWMYPDHNQVVIGLDNSVIAHGNFSHQFPTITDNGDYREFRWEIVK